MFVLFQLWLGNKLTVKLLYHRVAAAKMYVLRRTIPQFDPGRGAHLLDAESNCALQRLAHVQ